MSVTLFRLLDAAKAHVDKIVVDMAQVGLHEVWFVVEEFPILDVGVDDGTGSDVHRPRKVFYAVDVDGLTSLDERDCDFSVVYETGCEP